MRVKGVGFGIEVLGFRVYNLGLTAPGLWCIMYGHGLWYGLWLWFTVTVLDVHGLDERGGVGQGAGCRVSALGLRVWGSRFKVYRPGRPRP